MDDDVSDFLDRVKTDPVFHVEHVQGCETLEGYQKDICYAVAEHDRIAIAACHDLGKTFTMAKLVLWLGSVFEGAKILTTAPTFLQVEKLLWSEINTGFRQSKINLGGTMLNVEWKIDTDWFALGISPKDDADSGGAGQGTQSRFQGFHAKLLVIIFDEATGIHGKRWTQAEGMLTSAHTKFIAIGNPTSKNSEFFRCFNDPTFKKISLSCFDSPNLIANNINTLSDLRLEVAQAKACASDEDRIKYINEYKVVRPHLLTAQWVVNKAIKWGIEHPLFQSKALGEWPDEDEMALMSLGVVEGAMYRVPDTDDQFVSIGVDCARFGTDKTVITTMIGHVVQKPKVLTKRRETVIAGEIMNIIRALPRCDVICVDATGIGAGVLDMLIENQMLK